MPAFISSGKKIKQSKKSEIPEWDVQVSVWWQVQVFQWRSHLRNDQMAKGLWHTDMWKENISGAVRSISTSDILTTQLVRQEPEWLVI